MLEVGAGGLPCRQRQGAATAQREPEEEYRAERENGDSASCEKQTLALAPPFPVRGSPEDTKRRIPNPYTFGRP